MCKSVLKVLYRKLIRKKSGKYVISSAKTNTLEPVQLISYRIYEFDSTEVVYETLVDSNNDVTKDKEETLDYKTETTANLASSMNKWNSMGNLSNLDLDSTLNLDPSSIGQRNKSCSLIRPVFNAVKRFSKSIRKWTNSTGQTNVTDEQETTELTAEEVLKWLITLRSQPHWKRSDRWKNSRAPNLETIFEEDETLELDDELDENDVVSF